MSRGGGRGGRGGARGGRQQLPWTEDPNLKVDGRPAEAFPASSPTPIQSILSSLLPNDHPYDIPIPLPITDRERSQVRSLLLFREQVHDGPLYTATRSWAKTTPSGAATPRAYGQDQINQRYGVKTKATVDPFTAVEMPHSHLRRPERALPDLTDRPFTKSLFPPELHATLDGEDAPGGASAAKRRGKKKTMTLSKVTALRTAEEIFNMPDVNGGAGAGSLDADKDNHKKVLEALEQLDEAGGGDDELDLDDEEGFEQEMDEEYDDEDGGDDYDAEGYFDNGDDDDMDDGGGDEGVY